MMALIAKWIEHTFIDLARQVRWSFLPPLMVYFAAGLSGITSIVGAFFVKEYLGLSAAFLAGLAFWAGLPWALKMPLGHLVDIVWRWKAVLVYIGAAMIAASLTIMYMLVQHGDTLVKFMSFESWYVLSVLLAPCGYVLQDAVADAMSVEAVPRFDADGQPIYEALSKSLHTTMQTLGRISLISGIVFVALLNIYMFADVETMGATEKASIYGHIYLIALLIPVVSISGVILASFLKYRRRKRLEQRGYSQGEIERIPNHSDIETKPNYWYFGGGLCVALLVLLIGLTDVPFAQEIVFVGSMGIIIFLMRRLIGELSPHHARTLFGTAIIIFVFRATPLPGPGATWFEIDVLGFDQQFLSVLTLITSVLTLVGMIVLRPLMASKSITYIVVLLTVVAGVLSLPNIGLYYGIHNVTAPLTGGVVDARFIAILDTAIESPLGQVAMIPMLAWIARNAPTHLKATFFAVMASFTNLALSASALLTKYLNQLFIVTREVRDRSSGALETSADYSMLGFLLIVVALVTLIAPLLTIILVQRSRLKVSD